MLYKDIPIELRNSVLSYLESMIEYKRMYKLNEKDVLDMLNSDLRLKNNPCSVEINILYSKSRYLNLSIFKYK